MGRFRLTVSPATRARLWIQTGGLASAGGVGWEFGPGWGALLAGICAVAYGLLIVDVDEKRTRG